MTHPQIPCETKWNLKVKTMKEERVQIRSLVRNKGVLEF
jgi:hypothetical protein